MKFISKLAVTSAVIALAFISTANAQSMRVAVPFGFSAGNQQYPAGTYQVELNGTRQIVSLKSLDGKPNNYLLVNTTAALGTPALGSMVFNRYGNSYFLAKVNAPGSDSAAVFNRSRAEREVAKAQPTTTPEVVMASGR